MTLGIRGPGRSTFRTNMPDSGGLLNNANGSALILACLRSSPSFRNYCNDKKIGMMKYALPNKTYVRLGEASSTTASRPNPCSSPLSPPCSRNLLYLSKRGFLKWLGDAFCTIWQRHKAILCRVNSYVQGNGVLQPWKALFFQKARTMLSLTCWTQRTRPTPFSFI